MVRSWRRIVPVIGYHHLVMMLIIVVIVLQSVLLSGCSSSADAIRNIYVVSLKYSPSQNHTSTENSTFRAALATVISEAQLEVRVGYFGLCVTDLERVGWTCSNHIHDLRSIFNDTADPLNLIRNGGHFKDDIIFPYLIIVAIILELISFGILATFQTWHEEVDETTGEEPIVKPFPDRRIVKSLVSLNFVATVFAIIAAFWQHFSASSVSTTMEFTIFNIIDATVGSAAAALVWISFFLMFIVTIALLVMILAINFLDRLIDR